MTTDARTINRRSLLSLFTPHTILHVFAMAIAFIIAELAALSTVASVTEPVGVYMSLAVFLLVTTMVIVTQILTRSNLAYAYALPVMIVFLFVVTWPFAEQVTSWKQGIDGFNPELFKPFFLAFAFYFGAAYQVAGLTHLLFMYVIGERSTARRVWNEVIEANGEAMGDLVGSVRRR